MKPYYEERGIQIFHGDSAVVLPTLPADSIDLTVTSPPYDNLRTYNGYSFDFETVAQELYRVTKPGGVVVWVVGDATVDGSETGTSFRQALYFKKCGFNLHDTMIWNKNQFTATGSLAVRYAPVFEYMFVFSKGLPRTFNPIKDKRNISTGNVFHGSIRQPNGGMKKMTGSGIKTIAEIGQRHNIWDVSSEHSNLNRQHPGQFPEALANDHIRSWSNPGDTILDPFMGSNTTGKMARKNGCKFIGIEISEEYCQIAVNRLRQNVFAFGEATA